MDSADLRNDDYLLRHGDRFRTVSVSVIIPTYNGARTIRRAIDSVLNQEFDGTLEVIVIDDHSTDDTMNILHSYRDKIQVHMTPRPSGGPNEGRNMGIMMATGNLIAFLDQDDEWLPGKLSKQINAIKNGANFVYSRSIKRLEK